MLFRNHKIVTNRLIPEWANSEAIILAWPNENTDWAPWLDEARQVYLTLIEAINNANSAVIILSSPIDAIALAKQLPEHARVLIVEADYNDTWARDFAFLTTATTNGNQPVEFVFNGWGNKFDALLDNRINAKYLAPLCKLPMLSSRIVAEGGALEIDDAGNLLSTASCLFNPLRNGNFTEAQYQAEFEKTLGCETLTVFRNGHLDGDDTDGHIDTLVRFTPHSGIVIQHAKNRPTDPHFGGLSKLAHECSTHFPNHTIFSLPLPFIVNNEGERLPASYANYLVCNQKVFVPTYNQPEDDLALKTIETAYPDHSVEGVDCSVLVKQFGSLHCITMQVPVGTLKQEIIEKFAHGVSIHEAI